jgi:hypothetical protein
MCVIKYLCIYIYIVNHFVLFSDRVMLVNLDQWLLLCFTEPRDNERTPFSLLAAGILSRKRRDGRSWKGMHMTVHDCLL